MLPKLIFTIETYRSRWATEPYQEREFAYCWLAADDPTGEQLSRIIKGVLYDDVCEIYGSIGYSMTIGAASINSKEMRKIAIN